MFQEWFDINYTTDEDPMKIYEAYYNENVSNSNNQTKQITSKPNNNPDVKVSLLFIEQNDMNIIRCI